MIYSSEHSLCLEDSGTREVQLKRCSPDSESQQWLWVNQSMLMSAATSRCLYTRWSDDVVQMLPCRGPDPAGLEWDCHKGRLISRKTSLLLTASGQQVILSQQGKLSMWKSLDEEDFCKERLSKSRNIMETFVPEMLGLIGSDLNVIFYDLYLSLFVYLNHHFVFDLVLLLHSVPFGLSLTSLLAKLCFQSSLPVLDLRSALGRFL